jgi:hypothetical protein
MTYIIDEIEFDLSKPINKYWYSKFKKAILKNQIDYIKSVLSDAKNKNKIKYSQKYYACVKFIKSTTNLKFIKEENNSYYVLTFNDDFMDTYTVEHKTNLICSRALNNLVLDHKSIWGGKKIGKCINGCCTYYCKKKKFYIQWI